MTSLSFNLHRNYSNSPTLSNVGKLSWSWIAKNNIQVYQEGDKTWKQAFLRRSRKVTTKKCTKKRDISVKLLFCSLNVLNFRHSLRRRCRQIFLRSLYYIWELSVVLLESKKETFTYEYNDYSEDNFLIQIFQLFLLIHLGPVVRVFKYLFFKGINFSLLLLRWLNPVLAVCEYTVKFRK